MNPKEAKIQPSEVEIKWAESANPFKSLTDKILRDHFRFGEAAVSLKIEGNNDAVAILNKLKGTVFAQYLLPEGSVFVISKNIGESTYRDNDGKWHYRDEEPQPTVDDKNLVAVELKSHHERPHRYTADKKVEYFEYRHLAISFVYESSESAHQGYQEVVVCRTSEDATEGIMAPEVRVSCGTKYRGKDGYITSETGHDLYSAKSDSEKENAFLSFANDVYNLIKQRGLTNTPSK